MWNIKKSIPYKTRDKSWFYQNCLQETYKIFLDISHVIISHDIVVKRNAAPLSNWPRSTKNNTGRMFDANTISELKVIPLK